MALKEFAIVKGLQELVEQLLEASQDVRGDEQFWVGTFADYASFVESGTGPHKSSEGQQQFIENITEWAEDHGIENVYGLIEHIRSEGTEPHPFYRPAVMAVARRHDGLEVNRENRGRIDILVTSDFEGSIEQVAQEIAIEMKRRVPTHQGDLKRSIVWAESLEKLQKKSLQRLGNEDG